jgi:hypothetical protein
MSAKDQIQKLVESKTKWQVEWKGNAILFRHEKEPRDNAIYLNIGGFGTKPIEIKFFVKEHTWESKGFDSIMLTLNDEFLNQLKFPNQQVTDEGFKLIALKKYSQTADEIASDILNVIESDWSQFTNRMLELLKQ